jgi:hypothetical protein
VYTHTRAQPVRHGNEVVALLTVETRLDAVCAHDHARARPANRLSTDASCAQVASAFRGGLLSSFQSALIAVAVNGVPTIVASRAVRGRPLTLAGAAKGMPT